MKTLALLTVALLMAACAHAGAGCEGPRRPANPHGSVLGLAGPFDGCGARR